MRKNLRDRLAALSALVAGNRSLWNEARADGWRSTAVAVSVAATPVLILTLLILALFSRFWYLIPVSSVIGILAERHAIDDFLDLAEYLDHKQTCSTT
jgi:hypothetical protein